MDDFSADVAESAPSAEGASAPRTPSDRLAQMSPAETAAWRQTGEVPGLPPPAVAQGDGDGGDDEADAPAAEPGDARAVDAAPPAAVPPAVPPDASAAGKTLAKHKQTAQERINELAREKYRLEGELKALRSLRSPATADQPAPAPAPTPAPASGDGLVEPQEEDFDTYAAFVRASARYEARLAQAVAARESAQAQQAASYRDLVSAADARITAFAAAHPDFHDVIRTQTEVWPSPLLLDAVTHSALNAELAYHLNTHVDEYRALVALAPGPMLHALGKLEARLEAARSPQATGDAAAPSAHITRAPAPPVTLGSRPVEPADDVERAVARRDIGAYLRAANAREAGARR